MSKKKEEPKHDLDKILDGIDPEKLEEKYGGAHEEARNKYKVEVIRAPDREQFRKHVRNYVIHHTAEVWKARGAKGDHKMNDAEAEALAKNLLNSIYEKQGGFEGAYMLARKQGLRKVFDSLADGLKGKEKSEASALVMNSIDPQDFDGHVQIAKQYISKYGPHLPKSLKQKSPEQLAHNYDQLIKHHSELVGDIKGHLEKYEPKAKEKKAA
jgi:hypothetical protein